MKKLSIFLSAIFGVFIWISFASPSILNPSYVTNWDDIKIFWTDNSEWWYLDVNVQDPSTKDRLHFGEVKMSDQVFTYTKQWEWDQKIWIIPWDGGDQMKFTISLGGSSAEIDNQTSQKNEKSEDKPTRTVIAATPKTGPSGTLLWVIIATLVIFGGYIYIKKRADI